MIKPVLAPAGSASTLMRPMSVAACCANRGEAAQTAATTKAIGVGLNFFMVKAFLIGEGCKEN
jgi:hypothetical protein